jgi:predicted dinucleotide-binding enzyme
MPFLSRLLIVLISLAAGTMAAADAIAIIGTGDVARALGPEFAAQGHTIIYGSRDPGKTSVTQLVAATGEDASATTPSAAAAQAGIIVLAVPGMLVEEITRGLGDLSGKIIIDPTNPLRRGPLGLEHGVETSNGEIIQDAARGAYVVKAFNTLSWRTMLDPDEAGGAVSIPLAGDSAEAKAKVAELVAAMGLEPIDVGPVEYAHWIEGMLILWINNRYDSAREAFDFHLRKRD